MAKTLPEVAEILYGDVRFHAKDDYMTIRNCPVTAHVTKMERFRFCHKMDLWS